MRPLLMSMHFPKSADLFFHYKKEGICTLRYCRGVWILKEGFICNSMPLKWIFLIFLFFGQLIDTQRPAWDLNKMPPFYSLKKCFCISLSYSSSFSSRRLGSSNMAEGMVISRSLPHQFQAHSQPRVCLLWVAISVGHLFAHFTQAGDCGIENFHKYPRYDC